MAEKIAGAINNGPQYLIQQSVSSNTSPSSVFSSTPSHMLKPVAVVTAPTVSQNLPQTSRPTSLQQPQQSLHLASQSSPQIAVQTPLQAQTQLSHESSTLPQTTAQWTWSSTSSYPTPSTTSQTLPIQSLVGLSNVIAKGIMTADQLNQLKAQILAYKYITKSTPIPPAVLNNIKRAPPPSLGVTSSHADKVMAVTPTRLQGLDHRNTSTVFRTLSAPSPMVMLGNTPQLPLGVIKPPVMVEERPAKIHPDVLERERDRVLLAKIESRKQHVSKLLANAEGEEEKAKFLVVLKQLALVELQRRLRHEVATVYHHMDHIQDDDDDALFSSDNKRSRRAKEKRVAVGDEDARRMHKQRQFLDKVIQHSKDFKEYHLTRTQRGKKLARSIISYHNNQEKREQQRREREERERLRLLKINDEDAYLKMLEKVKNDRLQQLLSQTNEYLEKISALVKKEKESHLDERAEGDEEAVKGEEGKEEGAQGEASASNGSSSNTTTSSSSATTSATYYTSAHTIQETITTQPDLLEGGELKPYQLVGLQWLVSLYNNKLNGILADEMGLGKTIQTIALVAYLMEKKLNNGPYLVVVPLTTLANWAMEFEKWTPKIVRIVYKGVPKVRKQIYENHISTGKFNVVLTTFEYIMKDRPTLSKIKWNYIIIDEGHRMKNHNCKLSNTLGQYYFSRHRVLLTGTPLQNSLPELWSLLNFLLPSIFDCVSNFEQWFNAPFAATGENIEMNEEEKLLIIHRLHKVLRPFLLRRLKSEVEAQLPDKVEKVLKCDMSAWQRRMYALMQEKGVMRTGPSDEGGKKAGVKGLMNTLMQLRKICNHPYIFKDDSNWTVDDTLIRSSGKFELLDRILPKFKQSGHRILLFSQMTSLLTLLEDYLNYRGFTYLRLDGSTKADDRGVLLAQFNAPDSPYFIFILSTRAGGLGLNLQTADTVILFDSDWNPQIDLQAQDRAHRIGQTHEVRVFRLVCLNSIEERILARANFKLDIDAKIIQAGKFDNKSSAQDRRAMLEFLISREDQPDGLDTNTTPDDEEINEMIARSDEEFENFQAMDTERELADQARYKGRARPQRLMSESELPKWLLEELPDKDDDGLSYGRGARERPKIDYDDGLTDKQWERMIVKGDNVGSKRKRKGRADDDFVDGQSSSEDSDEAPQVEEDMRPMTRRGTIRHSGNSPVSSPSTPNSPSTPAGRGRGSSRGKRGRATSSVTPSSAPSGRGRGRGRGGAGSAKSMGPVQIKMDAIWEVIHKEKDSEGRPLSYLFEVLPSKKHYPDYYTVILRPIDMKTIRNKIRGGKYNSTSEYQSDFLLLFDNAQVYNIPESQVFNDAVHLQNLFKSEYLKHFGDGSSTNSIHYNNNNNNSNNNTPHQQNGNGLRGSSLPVTPASTGRSSDEEDSGESGGEEGSDSSAPVHNTRLRRNNTTPIPTTTTTSSRRKVIPPPRFQEVDEDEEGSGGDSDDE